MAGWFQRRDGFEWREHVRTTVLVRRADRDRKLERAQGAAVARIKGVAQRSRNVGRSGAGAVAQAFSAAMQQALAQTFTAITGVWGAIRTAGHISVSRARHATAWTMNTAARLWQRRPSLPDFRAIWAARPMGPIALPVSLSRFSIRFPGSRRIGPYLKPAAASLAAVSLAIGSAYVVGGPRFDANLAKSGNRTATTARASPTSITTGSINNADIAGRAEVVSGDTLRIDGVTLRLAGIEAPDAAQTCQRQTGRSWPCGDNAVQALRRLVRGRTLTCERSGTSDAGPLAICTNGTKDIAAELIAKGYVFASAGYFSRYAALEGEARAAKLGLWKGAADRPGDWRSARWEAARRDAPGGCPIKGWVRATGLVYALPWSKDYEKAPVRTAIGERWFCTEAEAKDAGWKPATKS